MIQTSGSCQYFLCFEVLRASSASPFCHQLETVTEGRMPETCFIIFIVMRVVDEEFSMNVDSSWMRRVALFVAPPLLLLCLDPSACRLYRPRLLIPFNSIK